MACVHPLMPVQYGLKDLVFETMLDKSQFQDWVPEFKGKHARIQGNPTMKGAVYTCDLPIGLDNRFPFQQPTQADGLFGPMNLVVVYIDRANIVDPRSGAEGVPSAMLQTVGPVLPPRFGVKVQFSVTKPTAHFFVDLTKTFPVDKGLMAPYMNRHADGDTIKISVSAVRVSIKVTIDACGQGNAATIAETYKKWFEGPYKKELEQQCIRMSKRTNDSIGWHFPVEEDKRFLNWRKTTKMDFALNVGKPKGDAETFLSPGKKKEGIPKFKLVDMVGKMGDQVNAFFEFLQQGQEVAAAFDFLAGTELEASVGASEAELQSALPVPQPLDDWNASPMAEAAAEVLNAPGQDSMGDGEDNPSADAAQRSAEEVLNAPKRPAAACTASGFLVTDSVSPMPSGAPRGRFQGCVEYKGWSADCCGSKFNIQYDVELDTATMKYDASNNSLSFEVLVREPTGQTPLTFRELYTGTWDISSKTWKGSVADFGNMLLTMGQMLKAWSFMQRSMKRSCFGS